MALALGQEACRRAIRNVDKTVHGLTSRLYAMVMAVRAYTLYGCQNVPGYHYNRFAVPRLFEFEHRAVMRRIAHCRTQVTGDTDEYSRAF
jgi:hypothetical protein